MTDTSRIADLRFQVSEKMPINHSDLSCLFDRIEALEAENERLRLDVEAQEALQVSAYHAGLRAGWNFGVNDDNAGMQATMANTDHIKELRRIREARAALEARHD